MNNTKIRSGSHSAGSKYPSMKGVALSNVTRVVAEHLKLMDQRLTIKVLIKPITNIVGVCVCMTLLFLEVLSLWGWL